MKTIHNQAVKTTFVTLIITLFLPAAPLYAGVGNNHESNEYKPAIENGGGNILPPTAEPRNYSLFKIAKVTANFNTTDRSGEVPNTPFQILYTSPTNPTNTFEVSPGTTLYVPILFNDDSLPVIGHLPDVRNRKALLNYFYSQKEFGTVYTKITVDGKEYSLGSDYLVGVKFPEPLNDGARNYMTSAAFLTPFKKGQHTVEISTKATGAAFSDPAILVYFPTGVFAFSTVYMVNVH